MLARIFAVPEGPGLDRIRLLVSDKSPGLLKALYEYYHGTRWQRCAALFYWKVQRVTPRGKIREVSLILKAIHAKEERESARRKAEEVASRLRDFRMDRAARIVAEGCEEPQMYYDFPSVHWRNLRTNSPLEPLNREIRRRTRFVGSFPDGHAALMLVSAYLRYMEG